MTKVSVIVPNYNHEKFLAPRLESIVNQTYKDFELIILDDASTDNSLEIIENYVNHFPGLIKFYPSDQNSGSPFIQWDKGIKCAEGEYIWIAESDDFASIYFLEYLVPLLEENKEVGIVCAKSNAINANGIEISEVHPIFRGFEPQLFTTNVSLTKYFKGIRFIENDLVYRCLIPNVSGILIRKSNYLGAGGLNLDYKRNGDYDLYFRLLSFSDIIFYNRTLNNTRYHDEKLTASNNAQSFKELSSILKPIFNTLKLSSSKRLEIMSFYFTVYKYDIFLNDTFSVIEKIKIFKNLSSLSGELNIKFFKFCLQRLKIYLAKKLK
ncbi:Glycosyltransferase involved in cell wall bisynthesis [Flavobacteriaceae bacterium MAR_2010_188]|nr:Glycosyltransferase involved in cell wall bisynthesis [Flavobacteriaceae bacterium MAR_2010_188]